MLGSLIVLGRRGMPLLGVTMIGCALNDPRPKLERVASEVSHATTVVKQKEPRTRPDVGPTSELPSAGRSPSGALVRQQSKTLPELDATQRTLLVSARRIWDKPWTECEDVHVYIVSLSPLHPERSAASLATTGIGRAHVVSPGQWIGDWELLAITDDWSGAKPHVWLQRGTEVCRARLDGNPARVPPPRSTKRKARRSRARR